MLDKKNLIDHFADAVSTLPPLPQVIQYEDDYDEKIRSFKLNECRDSIPLFYSGSQLTLQLSRFDQRVRELIKIYLLHSVQEHAVGTVRAKYYFLIGISAEDIEVSALSEPVMLKRRWSELTAKYTSDELLALKGLMAFLCQVRFGRWTPLHAEFISKAFPVKGRDQYSTVRSGDAFLDIQEEATLVRWLDAAAQGADGMSRAAAEIACVVACSYQFGMRPKQLGMVRKRDASVRISPEDGSAIVHLTFRMIKQQDATLSGLRLHRKIKREWAPLFVRLMLHKHTDPDDSFLFGFSSRVNLSLALIEKLEEILPESERRVAYDLRHSMAQRLVDSGASHEELAAAMGHTTLKSGLVYYRATANHAELVNKALGISDTYLAVAKIASGKFISPTDLAALKGHQQIAGVPHGIPIAGIGGCTSGQPSCPYNPVTACYGCPKFMPVTDLSLHEQVLEEFRGIVHMYKDVGRGETRSPAYLQLQRTISEVQSVIQELSGERP